MIDFRILVFAEGLVLPLVIPVSCRSENLRDCLQQIFAHDIIAARAEVWDGPIKIMQIDAAGIAALVDRAQNEVSSSGSPLSLQFGASR